MIPKILHYCFGMSRGFGGRPWSLVHYACVRSAVERIAPSRAYLYYEYEPGGPWWRLTKELVSPVKILAPRVVFGNPLLHPAHRADVVRLEKLIQSGGIYLDADVFVHRSFDDLLGYSGVVMGEETGEQETGLCNAVILATPNAPFLQRWRQAYKTFRSEGMDRYWNEHSVHLPARLAASFPEEVKVLPPSAFFMPNWTREGLDDLYRLTTPLDTSKAYANHLWESLPWEEFLKDLTPGRVRAMDSNVYRWFRPMVEDLNDNYGVPGAITLGMRRVRSKLRPVMEALRRHGRI